MRCAQVALAAVPLLLAAVFVLTGSGGDVPVQGPQPEVAQVCARLARGAGRTARSHACTALWPSLHAAGVIAPRPAS
jgi:hypothetical protein